LEGLSDLDSLALEELIAHLINGSSGFLSVCEFNKSVAFSHDDVSTKGTVIVLFEELQELVSGAVITQFSYIYLF
jgi:hypothetical protein